MSQTWNPEAYKKAGQFVPKLGESLIDLLNIRPGMRILDLGCGDGALTLKLIERGADVLGIDASAEMIRAAQEKEINAIFQDAHTMDFDNEFDAVFSNAALHWMVTNPKTVVENAFKALKPGGIFVGEMGGDGNIAAIRACQQQALSVYGLSIDDIAPKFFPTVATYQSMLEAAGFVVENISSFDRPTRLPDGLSEWVKLFSSSTVKSVPPHEIGTFLKNIENCAKSKLRDRDGWWADYVRLRFVAKKACA